MADLPPTGASPAWPDPPQPPIPPAGRPIEPAGTSGRGWKRVLPLAAVIGGHALVGIGLLVFLGYRIGPVALAVGLGAAILPVPVLVAGFVWLDRYEPEPVRYLALAFAWGAIFATSASLAVNTGASKLFESLGLPDALVAVLVAPFIEESTKALGPLLLLLARRREFSGITDGIVYCGLSATGFAMVENILYLGGYGYASGLEQYGPATAAQNVILLIVVRIVLTGAAHPLFTAMSGIGLGISARAGDRRVRWLAPVAGLLLAMMLHGAWNLMATLTGLKREPLVFLYGYFSIMVPIFLAMIGIAVWLRSWEGRLTERTLPVYVNAGWLSPPEVAALSTLGRRHSARHWARRVAGDAGVKAMRQYQYAATRLALLRDRMDRRLDRTDDERAASAREENLLLNLIASARQAFTGRDPATPPATWDGARYHVTFPDGVRREVAAPAEPVVPVPVVMGPPRPPDYPPPGHRPPGYPPPGFPGYP